MNEIIQQNALKEMSKAVYQYKTTGVKNSFLIRVEQLVSNNYDCWC